MVRGEVAIVGYACRVAGAGDSGALWRLLRENRCSVTQITPDRFSTQAFLHPSTDQRGRSYTFAAGVIDDIWGFDAGAFGISRREAEQVDPQQRHLLEVSHDALAHAGIRPSTLAGSETGVYIGASSADHAVNFFVDPSAADLHMMTGNSLSIMANRVSYTLDLRGPSLTVDTACSSSMVALDLAAEAIRNGTIDTAIVGGVNLILSPFSYVGFSRASMLSPTGLCRPFDAAADGYVRAEGAIVVVLRSMAAAHKARNRIHAVIVGSGVNQDGRTTGLSMPSAESQRQLLDQVYAKFAVDPADLSFVEAHGTGTQVGDPIEADALGKGLGQRRSRKLPIGSIKSNVGHLEPVSGLAGLVKSVLALDHGLLPATLHQQAPSPNIDFNELNLDVVGRNRQLPERRGPELVGVNSFGFGGTNAHAILRSDHTVTSFVQVPAGTSPPPLLLSAHSADALPALAAAHLAAWPRDARRVHNHIVASAHQRDALPHRLIVRGGAAEEMRAQLDGFVRGEAPPGVLTDQALGTDLPVVFLFSGNGSQWAGMGRDAWEANPVFREALTEIDAHFAKAQKWSITELLFAEDLAPRLRRATYSQPLLFALQVATVRALEAHGLRPQAALGHSVGEIAAAWCAGVLSLEQAIEVVLARSRHQEAVRGSGAMAALMLSDREARRFLMSAGAPEVEVAAINSWRSVTVSGPAAEIDKILEAAATLRISARRLDLDYPFHSALVDPVRGPLLRELKGLKPLVPHRRFISSVTGGDTAVTGADAPVHDFGPEHWWRNVREPVQFEAALNALLKDEMRLFVEIGPRPILASYARDVLREAGLRGAIIESLAEAPVAGDSLERCVARVVLAGGEVDRQRFFGAPPPTALQLPLYPWQHSPFRLRPSDEANTVLLAATHPLLGLRPRSDGTEWYATIDPALYPWIADHKVGGVTVLPATAYVEILLAAAREVHGDGALQLRDFDIVRPLVFDGHSSLETKVRLTPETGIVELLSRPRSQASDWTLNARGIVSRSPIAAKATLVPEAPTGAVIVPKARVYAWACDLGFDYGPSFQRVRQVVFPEPKFAVAALERPEELVAGSRIIDLTALDAGFNALFASEEAGVADMPMKRMLPVRFSCVRVFDFGAVAVRTTARTLRQSQMSMVVDIDLWDENDRIVVSAQGVRLVEAPVDLAADPHALSYRTTPWQLDAAGVPTVTDLSMTVLPDPAAGAGEEAASLAEGLLLIEAGSLRAAWNALQRLPAPVEPPTQSDGSVAWPAFVRSALLWHLESKNLVIDVDGARTVSPDCDVPEIFAIAASLLVRHPTMATEAASLSRLEEIIGRMIASDQAVPTELASAHWKQLGAASAQIAALRTAVTDAVAQRLGRCDGSRLFRFLMIGADHVEAGVELCRRFPNLEIILTDIDEDRLEHVRAALGQDVPQIRSIGWPKLDALPAGTLDLAFAVDALSEVAALAGGLDRLTRVLRPNAVVVAGELAPSAFWDVVRGTRDTWWARSANADFPMGALLTAQEWIDELEGAGFSAVVAEPVLGEARIGVVVEGIAGPGVNHGDVPIVDVPTFHWEGDAGDLRAALEQRTAAPPSPPPSGATDFVLAARASNDDPVGALTDILDTITEQFRRIADTTARYWLIVDFGPETGAPLEQPVWCALTAALRVAQNEYSGLEIRCIGLSGGPRARVLENAMAELLSPGDERELFFVGSQRIAFRVERGGTPPREPEQLSDDTALRLMSRQGTSRGTLAWIPDSRPAPGSDEVEIAVATTGVNFRDVMWNLRLLPEEALEDGYAGAGLGMECAGTVTRTGANVAGLAPGDRVLAFVPNAFASHVIAPSFAVSRIPEQLSFAAATTLPVAFLTSYYSLVHLARVSPGEVVLIHGGAGAVGLAALQIAKYRGAIVIATAGSEEKRALLRNLGADFVCNSRTLAFADEILAHTGGKGVDVVLNSLAGDAMIRSFECMKPFGRFIELGKRDFYANTHLGLRPLRRNISYFGVDVDQLIGGHRQLTERLFAEVIRLLVDGALTPLPHRVFEGSYIGDAFRLMQRAGHIGKIVVTPATRASVAEPDAGAFPVSGEGLHIVIGGTSGFGLATAEWLADRGACHLVLASRSGQLSEASALQVEALRARGLEVEVTTVDVADFANLQQFLKRTKARGAIKGIVNAAMVLDDRLMQGLDRGSIAEVLGPKAAAAVHFERLVDGLGLDYLLLFSSATTLFGNPGQFNYVAANGFVEGMARRLKARGVPALSVAWGAIEDAGYLARHIKANANLKKRFSSTLMPSRMALDGLAWAFDAEGKQKTACCAIARVDWAMAKRELAAVRSPTFTAIHTAGASRQDGQAAVTLEKLRAMPAEEAATALLDIVVEEIARALRLPPKEVDRHRPLADIGMDSLMMLELRGTVEASLQIDLPMMSLASGITPADVARRIAPLITGENPAEGVPSTIVTLSASHFAAEAEASTVDDQQAAISAVLERVKQLDSPR